jgi:hypothetical protein
LKQIFLLLLLLIISITGVEAQLADTAMLSKDSIALNETKPVITSLQRLLEQNDYLNSEGTPASVAVRVKKVQDEAPVFYLIAALIFFFGIIKSAYARYFSNLFKVFFNSSLRQSQLTDQLLQSKLPSLFFNLLFLLASGLYVYFLLPNTTPMQSGLNWLLLGYCVVALFTIYLVKFLTLKFVGWVTGYQQETDTYIFLVFLINKIIGICLLPVIIILAFSQAAVVNVMVVISFLLIGVMLLLRFFRSYGLLQHKLKVSRFHFIIYIFSLEVLPLMLIYKAVEVFIVKNL